MKRLFTYSLGLTALLAVAAISLFVLTRPVLSDSPDNSDQHTVDRLVRLLPGRYSAAYITSAILRGEFKPEELEQLNFALPGESDYDANSRFSIVRLLDTQRSAFIKKMGYYGNREVIDAITTVKGNRLVFNLRRMTNDDKRITDILYAVLPDMNPYYCSTEDGGVGNLTVYNADADFQVAPNHHTVVELPADFKRHENNRAWGLTCVYLPDGKKYLFIELYERTKLRGEKEWR